MTQALVASFAVIVCGGGVMLITLGVKLMLIVFEMSVGVK